MLTINTNVMALSAQLALNQHTQEINRLTKALIDANGDGAGSGGLNGPAASIVPSYLTSQIRGTAQAIANTESANQLLGKESETFTSIETALLNIRDQVDKIKVVTGPLSSGSDAAATVEEAKSKIQGYLDSLAPTVAGNIWNGLSLSNSKNLKFQIGPNQKDNINVVLVDLESIVDTNVPLLALTTPTKDLIKSVSVVDDDGNTITHYEVDTSECTTYAALVQTFYDQIHQSNGSVTANVSRLAFIKSRLEADSDRTIDYRSKILSDIIATTNAKLAVQRMLQSVAEAVLAQANVSRQGVLDLISAARIH